MFDDKGNFLVNKLVVVNEYWIVFYLNFLFFLLNFILIYFEGKDFLDGVVLEVIVVNSFLEVFEGSIVKLICVVIGILYLKVIWLIDGSFVEISECVIFDCDGEFLLFFFLSIELDDEGEY